jgi:hypothetical protein
MNRFVDVHVSTPASWCCVVIGEARIVDADWTILSRRRRGSRTTWKTYKVQINTSIV